MCLFRFFRGCVFVFFTAAIVFICFLLSCVLYLRCFSLVVSIGASDRWWWRLVSEIYIIRLMFGDIKPYSLTPQHYSTQRETAIYCLILVHIMESVVARKCTFIFGNHNVL